MGANEDFGQDKAFLFFVPIYYIRRVKAVFGSVCSVYYLLLAAAAGCWMLPGHYLF